MWHSTLYCLPFLLVLIHGVPLEEAEDDVTRQLLAQLLLKKNENKVERPSPFGLLSPAPLSRFLRSQESTLLSLLDPDRLTTHSDHSHVRTEDSRTDTPLGCVGVNCLDDSKISQITGHWTMPLKSIGRKKYYLGIFFKANWYKASQYCRFHGMHLASIDSAEQNKKLENYIQSFGLGHEHFWTSGTDQGQEGQFVWMATGTPITFTNWNAGEPNNFVYENGEEEHCLELWNRDGKGLKWNDSPCSFETYFVCEVQPQ